MDEENEPDRGIKNRRWRVNVTQNLLRYNNLLRLCFAMTINKAQGQTIPNVGVYLPEPVFSHGQLYVALSRGISRGNTKVLVKSVEKSNVDEVYTSNVVYKEVLSD
ncbi:hypothetical protein LXL04_013087 [Taraxacum kok-saghyz]